MRQPAAIRLQTSGALESSRAVYRDRIDAAERLAEALAARGVAPGGRPLVLGIPRGGVVLARIVADRLGGDLDVVVPHKIGAPWNAELAIGAVASDGPAVIDDRIVRMLRVSPRYIDDEIARQRDEIRRRLLAYRGDAQPVDPAGRDCIVVDDGMATGATAEAAVLELRARGASRVIMAAPVASDAACARLRRVADDVVCPLVPEEFVAVGQWFERFDQVSDASVIAELAARA
ncbi:MAG TPA: phosphoribosyltransferase family protein [Actinomycetota bacterium]